MRRGDGVGIEFTRQLARGVRLDADETGHVAGAGEVAVRDNRDDRSIVDAFVRLRAELGGSDDTTRIGMFPPTSTLRRLDVTGFSGPELNGVRDRLAHEESVASTLLLDDGPRRWLVAVRWDESEARRIEVLAEMAGFVDVTVEPSPVAIARVLDSTNTRARRDAASGESFEALFSSGLVVVAAAVDSVGYLAPSLWLASGDFSPGWFDGITEQVELVAELRRILELSDDNTGSGADTLLLGEVAYPPFPPHDTRSPQRLCVALGAAVGAAGLAGRLRPVDMSMPYVPTPSTLDRPWVIERISNVAPKHEPTVGPVRRSISRMIPRRR